MEIAACVIFARWNGLNMIMLKNAVTNDHIICFEPFLSMVLKKLLKIFTGNRVKKIEPAKGTNNRQQYT
jgi:hypothetical protein